MWLWSKAGLVIVLTLGGALSVSAQAPLAQRDAAVSAVFTRHMASQARTLDCVAVIEPQRLAATKQAWVEIIESAERILQRGGFPRESAAKFAAGAQPDKLMTRADPEKMRASCVTDKAWENHWARFMAYTLVGDVREIVEGRR